MPGPSDAFWTRIYNARNAWNDLFNNDPNYAPEITIPQKVTWEVEKALADSDYVQTKMREMLGWEYVQLGGNLDKFDIHSDRYGSRSRNRNKPKRPLNGPTNSNPKHPKPSGVPPTYRRTGKSAPVIELKFIN